MESREILDLQFHKVYYVKTEYVNFYLSVPKNVDNTSISIDIKNKMSNYNMETNDVNWVMNNIVNTFNYVDNYNITLVIPIFNQDSVNILEKINSSEYDKVDKLMSNLINVSYNVLSSFNIKVNTQVILINNDRYKSFITWFITKYQGRVVCKNMLELIQIYNVNATEYQKLETPVMNFVIGNYISEINAPKIVKEEFKEEKIVLQKPKLQPNAGFVSYFALIGMSIILSIITFIII